MKVGYVLYSKETIEILEKLGYKNIWKESPYSSCIGIYNDKDGNPYGWQALSEKMMGNINISIEELRAQTPPELIPLIFN